MSLNTVSGLIILQPLANSFSIFGGRDKGRGSSVKSFPGDSESKLFRQTNSINTLQIKSLRHLAEETEFSRFKVSSTFQEHHRMNVNFLPRRQEFVRKTDTISSFYCNF
jgi:hypothetical protein